MNKFKLLQAIYEAIQWDRLYGILPGADRQQVDEFFRELREHLGPQAEEDMAAEIAGGSALLYCDGASSGNPGPAGVGMVLAAPDGREVLAWSKAIGEATNNVAEYRAAIEGLKKALELEVGDIRLLTDSELLVRQVKGEYRVKSAGLQPLHAELKELLGRFASWEVQRISRDTNRRADSLAARHARKRQ